VAKVTSSIEEKRGGEKLFIVIKFRLHLLQSCCSGSYKNYTRQVKTLVSNIFISEIMLVKRFAMHFHTADISFFPRDVCNQNLNLSEM